MFVKSMKSPSHPSSSASHHLEELPSLPPSFADVRDITEESDVESSLIKQSTMKRNTPSVKPTWLSDATDLFILLCTFLFITASTVLLGLVFYGTTVTSVFTGSSQTLLILQRIIATFSVSITTAIIMVTGKRYVLFKLPREGLRSRRVAVYSNPAIGNLASYLVLRGVELPLLGLAVAWGLALATGLTVNDTWQVGSVSSQMIIPTFSGPLNVMASSSSYLLAASEQLGIVMSSLCLGVAGTFGLINVTSANVSTGPPVGIVYYPPPPQWATDIGYSYTTTMNSFNISMEQLSSLPSTAQNITCRKNFSPGVELLYNGSDNQTLSVVVVESFSSSSTSIFQFNATAIIVGGTLSSTGNYRGFALNGTSWPNVMEAGNQWAQDITALICNATCPYVGDCSLDSTLFDFVSWLQVYNGDTTYNEDATYSAWSSVLSMALGAYSAAVIPPGIDDGGTSVPITMYNRRFTTRYGIYILTVNTVVLVIMLIVAARLRRASRLGPDFINSTRLLLDPLKQPDLFNASLDTTMEVLSDPYILVKEDSMVLLTEQKSVRDQTVPVDTFTLRRLSLFNRTQTLQ